MVPMSYSYARNREQNPGSHPNTTFFYIRRYLVCRTKINLICSAPVSTSSHLTKSPNNESSETLSSCTPKSRMMDMISNVPLLENHGPDHPVGGLYSLVSALFVFCGNLALSS